MPPLPGRLRVPRDRALGMEKRSLSPAVTRMIGVGCGRGQPSGHSGEMLQELAGLRVETKQVERTAKASRAEVAEDDLCRVELPVQPPVSTLYLGMDGTGVPVRPSECEGRPYTASSWLLKDPARSNWCLSVVTCPQCDRTGRPLHDPDSVSYSAAIESAATVARIDTDPEPSAFAQRVDREARDAGASPKLNGTRDPWAGTAPPGSGTESPGNCSLDAIEIVDGVPRQGPPLGIRQGDLWPRHRPRRSMGPN